MGKSPFRLIMIMLCSVNIANIIYIVLSLPCFVNYLLVIYFVACPYLTHRSGKQYLNISLNYNIHDQIAICTLEYSISGTYNVVWKMLIKNVYCFLLKGAKFF